MARNRNVRWRLKRKGFQEVRRAPKVIADLERRAKNIAEDANAHVDDNGYKTSSQQGAKRPQGRWRTTVITATKEAQNDNAEHNRLLRSFDAGRR